MPRRRRVSRPTGIGEIGKANRRKGQRPFLKTPETSEASFCLGASATKGGLTVAPFGISASRNRQSPPNCPKFSGSGYVQTVALGLGRDGVRTGAGKNLRFAGIEVLAKPIFVRGLPLQWRRHCRFHAPSGGRKNWHRQFFRSGQDPLYIYKQKKRKSDGLPFF